MTDKLNIDDEEHVLHLGKSFDADGGLSFHSIRYDFKPQSLDLTKTATVDIGQNHSVTVKVPHISGSSASHTEYRGNKRPCQKECVIIIDHVTGEFTLEKLSYNLQVKSTRTKSSSSTATSKETKALSARAAEKQTVAPATKKSKVNGELPVKDSVQPVAASVPRVTISDHKAAAVGATTLSGESSSSSSSSEEDSSSSDSDSDDQRKSASFEPTPSASKPDDSSQAGVADVSVRVDKSMDVRPTSYNSLNLLNEDLQLSESDSDG